MHNWLPWYILEEPIKDWQIPYFHTSPLKTHANLPPRAFEAWYIGNDHDQCYLQKRNLLPNSGDILTISVCLCTFCWLIFITGVLATAPVITEEMMWLFLSCCYRRTWQLESNHLRCDCFLFQLWTEEQEKFWRTGEILQYFGIEIISCAKQECWPSLQRVPVRTKADAYRGRSKEEIQESRRRV